MISKIILVVVGIPSFLFLLGLGYFYFTQERLLFFPEVLPSNFKFEFSGEFSEHNLQVGESKINYLTFRGGSPKGVIIYFHGNAGSLQNWGFVAERLANVSGWEVVIVDYPGFGKSSGPLPKTERPLLEVARAMKNEVLKSSKQRPVVVFGRSLGSGIATALAKEWPVAGLILETPYRSLARLGHEIYPFLPEFFCRFDLDNERDLAALNQTPDSTSNSTSSLNSTPTLILHGHEDEVIPFAHGEFLSRSHGQIEFVAIQGGRHNDLAKFAEFESTILNFLNARLVSEISPEK